MSDFTLAGLSAGQHNSTDDWTVDNSNGQVSAKTVVGPGSTYTSTNIQRLDLTAPANGSFAIGMKIQTDHAEAVRLQHHANAGIIFNMDESTNSFDVAYLRSGQQLWKFETWSNGAVTSTDSELRLKGGEVRDKAMEIHFTAGSSIARVKAVDHNSKAGDTVRFSAAGGDMNLAGNVYEQMKQLVVTEVIDNDFILVDWGIPALHAQSYIHAGNNAGVWYHFDQDVVLRFDPKDNGLYNVRFYDKRQGALLSSKDMVVDLNKKFGVIANHSESYFQGIEIGADVIQKLEDALSSVDGFSVTVPDNQFGVADLNTLLGQENDYYTVTANDSASGIFTMDGQNLSEGDIIRGDEKVRYNQSANTDTTASLFVSGNISQTEEEVIFDGPVNRIVVEETPEQTIEDRVEVLETASANVIEGPQGPAGPAGPRGSQGAAGEAGIAGPQGIAGPAGVAGPQGEQGAQGSAGVAGPAGSQGLQGSTGPIGAQGAQGEQGPAGLQGPKGDRGEQGIAGAQGSAGQDGAVGPQGAQGSRGETGAQGPAGVAGADGQTGPQGPQGERGAQGVSGPQGVAGERGLDGAAGPAGIAGATGPQGPAGDDFNGDERLACLEAKIEQLITQMNQAKLLSGNGVNFTVSCD